jgi:hypothetical protein
MSYYAEINQDGVVVRVIVCDDPQWITDNLGGTWAETADPYAETPAEVTYCGPGHGFDDTFPERFAQPWRAWDGENESLYQTGDLVFHDGRIWRCTTTNNAFEPGVSGRHDAPEVGYPLWVQPTGDMTHTRSTPK